MSTPDISKIIELIMQNPSLISEIQGLVKSENEAKPEPKPEVTVSEERDAPPMSVSAPFQDMSQRARRSQLLCAMRSYVSSERAKAIDSMLAISEILDVMKVGK